MFSKSTFSNFMRVVKEKSLFLAALSFLFGVTLRNLIKEIVDVFIVIITGEGLTKFKSRKTKIFGRTIQYGKLLKSFIESIFTFVISAILFENVAYYILDKSPEDYFEDEEKDEEKEKDKEKEIIIKKIL